METALEDSEHAFKKGRNTQNFNEVIERINNKKGS